MIAASLDARPQLAQQRDLIRDIADQRDVVERDLLIGQQSCGKQGQGGVLVASGRDAAAELAPALDDESFHRASVMRDA
jgi:hypothetical protein